MSEIEGMSNNMECVKIALNQDKTGFILKLSIHPNDVPEDLLRDPVGTRYIAVLVRVDEQGQPAPSPQQAEGEQAVRIAGALCADFRFQQWLYGRGYVETADEESAATYLRRRLGVQSRKELRVDAAARQRLLNLRDEFVGSMRSDGADLTGRDHRA